MKLKLILIGLITAVLISGCGGGGSSSDDSSTPSECEYSSITVTPTSGDAVIQTVLNSSSNCTELKLTTGTADITLDGSTVAMILNQVYTVDTD
jgi:hypothetical protein